MPHKPNKEKRKAKKQAARQSTNKTNIDTSDRTECKSEKKEKEAKGKGTTVCGITFPPGVKVTVLPASTLSPIPPRPDEKDDELLQQIRKIEAKCHGAAPPFMIGADASPFAEMDKLVKLYSTFQIREELKKRANK